MYFRVCLQTFWHDCWLIFRNRSLQMRILANCKNFRQMESYVRLTDRFLISPWLQNLPKTCMLSQMCRLADTYGATNKICPCSGMLYSLSAAQFMHGHFYVEKLTKPSYNVFIIVYPQIVSSALVLRKQNDTCTYAESFTSDGFVFNQMCNKWYVQSYLCMARWWMKATSSPLFLRLSLSLSHSLITMPSLQKLHPALICWRQQSDIDCDVSSVQNQSNLKRNNDDVWQELKTCYSARYWPPFIIHRLWVNNHLS